MLREWLNRLWGALRRNAREQEIEEELRCHLEMAAEDLQSPREARLEYGSLTQAMESMRDQRGLPWIDNLILDLRYGLRILGNRPGFTALAVTILAFGIGANTAVFSVVNTVLLKPLAYHDPDRIVTVTNPWTTGEVTDPLAISLVSIPNFEDWKSQSSSFEAMAFYYNWEAPVLVGSTAEYGRIAKVSPEFFRVFAVEPVIGRFFSAEETRPRTDGGLLISYTYWQSHFAGDYNVLGRAIRIYGTVRPIVGVLPPGFGFPDKTDLWFPDNDDSPVFHARDENNHFAIARLKPGVSLKSAQTEVAAIARRLEQQYPKINKNRTVVVERMQDEMVKDIRFTLYLLLGSVGVVLLIACANTAALLLGKATARTREIALRASLGASRSRIARQFMVESLLLALIGGVVGLALAYGGAKALVLLAPEDVPRLEETAIDRWVLAFTLGLSVVTSFLFGLVPALCALRIGLSDALKPGARFVRGNGLMRARGVLVAAEIALAVVLLCGSGLLIKSFVAIQNVALGFRPENVLVLKATGPGSIRDTNLFFRDVLAQVRSIPGVVQAGATMVLPGHFGSAGNYYIDHLPQQRDSTGPAAAHAIVTPGTFAALAIPIRKGRDFEEDDMINRPFVAIVNEALVQKSLRGEDPIGRTIYCGFDSERPMRIIGVVGNVREHGPAREAEPECYMSYRQHVYNNSSLNIVARTTGDPLALEQVFRRLAHDRSPDVPVTFTTLEKDASKNIAAPRFRTVLFAIFAGLALCLAMAGVYGVMAYTVGQRTSEIGVRMALGASSGDVQRMVLGQGIVHTIIGLALGLAGAVASTRLLTSMLFQVSATDPVVYFTVPVLLGAVALTASYFPARRASKIDPLTAIREE